MNIILLIAISTQSLSAWIFLQNQFDCTVINNACSGATIEFIIDNFTKLVDEDDDIIICLIGTNNRHVCSENIPSKTRREHMEDFYNHIIALHNKFKAIGKDVIFVANIPASVENEKFQGPFWRLFHMNDVNDLYMKAAAECGFPFISMYMQYQEYCEIKDISIDTLLCDGLHPNDKGHELIFKFMLHALGIGIRISNAL